MGSGVTTIHPRGASTSAITKDTAQPANLQAISPVSSSRLSDGGYAAFSHLLQLITPQFGAEDRGDSFTRLNSSCVPSGMTFAKFLQGYRAEVSNVAHFASAVKADIGWILEISRSKINSQCPTMMSVCYPQGG